MAISAADRARHSERISQTREEAEEREAKLLKRKNEQLKRAEARHQQEIKKLNQAYQSQLNKVRDTQKDTLIEREADHQEDLSSLRKNYTENLQRKTETAETEKRILRENSQSELSKQKIVAQSQKENLLQNQEQELNVRDRALEGATTLARERMKEAIDTNSKRLKEAHSKELNVVRDYQDNNQIQNQLDKDQMRKAYANEKAALKRQAEYSNATWKQKYDDLSNQLSGDQEDGLSVQGKMLQEGLNNVKDRYQKKLAEKSEQIDKSNEAFRDTINDRVDSQVRSRDSKVQALKGKLNNQIVNDKRMREIERTNLQSTYEDKMHIVEDQRDQIKESMQELNAKRIGDMKSRNDNVLKQASQDYRSQVNLERAKFRENALTMEQIKADEIARANDRAEVHIEKMQRVANQNVQKMGEFYGENIDQARLGFEQKIVDQRERNIELQGQNSRIMKERFHKLEKNYAKKLDMATERYETQLQEMKDKHEKEIRRMEANLKLKLEDKEKGHRTDKDSTEMKYEAKIALMQQEQQDRLEKVQKRHQEELRDLALKMNQYNRKA